MNRPLEEGPKPYPVYLRLPYLGKQEKFLESKVKNTFGVVNLRISHFTKKPLNGKYKDFTPDPEKTTLYTNWNFTVIVSTLGEHLKYYI